MRNETPMQLLVSQDATSADLHIMGNVYGGFWKGDEETSAQDVAQALSELPETCQGITVHINSMGGEVGEGVAIYNALKSHRAKVTTVCEGFACSIASVIFMAGDERIMRDASMLMIHDAWMYTSGNADELRKAADDLETITELSKRAYMERIGDRLTREELDALMDGETWILPEQAVEWGLATSVDEPESESAPEQSAMRIAMQRLTEPVQVLEAMEAAPLDISDESVARVAQAVLEAIDARQDPNQEPAPKPKSFMQRVALMYANDAR